MTACSTGSLEVAAEKLDLTTFERTVVAGWRLDTSGTVSFGDGLYSPLRTIVLDLLAMSARWYLTYCSSYPLATMNPEYSCRASRRSKSLEWIPLSLFPTVFATETPFLLRCGAVQDSGAR